jgi:hypothetical protein
MSGAGDISNLIAVINPKKYFKAEDKNSKEDLEKLKKLVNGEGIAKGMKLAKEEGIKVSPKPVSSYKITFDAQTNQLEPNYYWVLDFMQDAGVKFEKIVDNFTASPGSGQFSEIGQKKAVMQQQVTKISGDINQVTKSIIQLIYDLREFEIRLSNYTDLKDEKDKQKAEAARIGLKQIWLDSVDIKKGPGAIHQMAMQGGFTTVRDLFMIANSLDDVEKLAKEGNMNDQVKRILLPRISEFQKWLEFSEQELRKRYSVEKSYLKSQIEMLKLYTSWIKPYLKAAGELEQNGFKNDAALVNSFSTSMLEMTLLGKQQMKKLPEGIKSDYKLKRDYFSVYVVDFTFRGPSAQRTQTGDYAYMRGGRMDMTFDCYALNSEELGLLKKELDNQSLELGLKFFSGETEATLEALKEDIAHFLDDDKKKEEKEKKEKDTNDTNPFSALGEIFSGLFKSEKKDKKEDKKKIEKPKDIEKDNFVEEGVREMAADSAKGFLYAVYDVYKKAHGMASSPESFDN